MAKQISETATHGNNAGKNGNTPKHEKKRKRSVSPPFLECNCNLLDNGNIVAVNPLQNREGGQYTYTLAALALSRHSYSNYAPYGLQIYFD